MNKTMLASILILYFNSTVAAQPDTLWTRTYGGGQPDQGNSIQQTSDGGFIITGYTNSYGIGPYNAWLMKTDALGDTLWTKVIGGIGHEYGYSVHQTSDGGYVFTGVASSYGTGGYDAWLVKTDASGEIVWMKTYGGSQEDWGFSVEQTSDGGFIITGYTTSFGAGDFDVWLIKTDASGDSLWSKTFGGSGYDYGISVHQTSDGGYIILGSTSSYGAGRADVWLIKTGASGDSLWSKTFGGSGYDNGTSFHQISDGGYIISAGTSSYGSGSVDVWLIKTDASGDSLWSKTFGGSGYDPGTYVHQTHDEGFIITGFTSSFGAGSYDVWLIKTDASGDSLWSMTFGGVESDNGIRVLQTSDWGFVVLGGTSSFGAGQSDVYLIRLASEFSTDLSVSIPDLFVEPAETLWVPVDVSNTSGYEIHASEFTLTYDTSFAELLDVDFQGTLPTAAGWLIEHNPVPGSLRVAMSGDTPLSGEGALANIQLVITGDTSGSSSTPLVLSPFLFNEGNPAVQVINGSLTVGAPVLSLNPETISFGTVQVGQFAVDSLVISNTGTGDLEIFSITWNDTAFDVTLNIVPDFLPPGSHVRLDVYFMPEAHQLYSDLLTVSTNAGDGTVILVGNGIIVGVEPYDARIPTDYALRQNYPNPFNPITDVRYAVPVSSHVLLSVYNIQGQEVARLVDGEMLAGYHNVKWDAGVFSSGVYLYRIHADDFIDTKKLILMK